MAFGQSWSMFYKEIGVFYYKITFSPKNKPKMTLFLRYAPTLTKAICQFSIFFAYFEI